MEIKNLEIEIKRLKNEIVHYSTLLKNLPMNAANFRVIYFGRLLKRGNEKKTENLCKIFEFFFIF